MLGLKLNHVSKRGHRCATLLWQQIVINERKYTAVNKQGVEYHQGNNIISVVYSLFILKQEHNGWIVDVAYLNVYQIIGIITFSFKNL